MNKEEIIAKYGEGAYVRVLEQRRACHKEHTIYELDENADVELKIKRKYPYKNMLAILAAGNTFFLAVERRSAAYVRKKLEKELDELIETTFSVYTTPEGEKLEGYTFSFGLVKDYLEKVHVEG